MSAVRGFVDGLVAGRVDGAGREWYARACAEIGAGVTDARFAGLIAIASRRAPRRALAPAAGELERAAELCEGWNPERWSVLEAVRCGLVLARPDLPADSGAAAIEEAFRFADVGELCALYRSLALLPGPARFAWRAGEGCRSNMTAVFEAAACDTPFPLRHFDDVAWRQLVLKAIFVEAPLWRVFGLDGRLSEELARMALDLADERRSAGRAVQHGLWLCLGAQGGERARASIERELAGSHTLGRRAAAYALARAGSAARLRELAAGESDPAVAAAMRDALAGNTTQAAFRGLDPTLETMS